MEGQVLAQEFVVLLFFPCSVLGIGHCFHVSEAEACKFLCWVLVNREKNNLRFNHG